MNLKKAVYILFLLNFNLIWSQGLASSQTIIIDVGHGGKDLGTIGAGGLKEKDIVLQVALEIVELNRTLFENSRQLYLTRYSDTLISLRDRSLLLGMLDADLFMSLHVNSGNPRARGVEVFLPPLDQKFRNNEFDIVKSNCLASSILDEFHVRLGINNRGIKTGNFQVLRQAVKYCPAILVELGFVTNADEGNYFRNRNNIKAIALAILMGIDNYYKNEI